MSEGDLNPQPTPLFGELRGEAVQADRRSAVRVARNLYLPPADSPRPRERLHCLVNRFLRGNAGRRVPGGIRPGGQILALPGGKEPGHRLLAFAREQQADALKIHQIDAYPNSCHPRDHQKSAKPCRKVGTGM